MVEEIELSCVAGLPRLTGGRTAVTCWFSLLPSCEGQAFRGDRMGATWTHVRLGSELWPALYCDSLPCSSLSLSFPFVSTFSRLLPATSGEFWFASVANVGGREARSLSSPSGFTPFSSALMRGHFRSTGEGAGESVPVQLSLRFWKVSRRVICEWVWNLICCFCWESGGLFVFSNLDGNM